MFGCVFYRPSDFGLGRHGEDDTPAQAPDVGPETAVHTEVDGTVAEEDAEVEEVPHRRIHRRIDGTRTRV